LSTLWLVWSWRATVRVCAGRHFDPDNDGFVLSVAHAPQRLAHWCAASVSLDPSAVTPKQALLTSLGSCRLVDKAGELPRCCAGLANDAMHSPIRLGVVDVHLHELGDVIVARRGRRGYAPHGVLRPRLLTYLACKGGGGASVYLCGCVSVLLSGRVWH